jgi:predicted DNA-binding transcriptional regulator YafY
MVSENVTIAMSRTARLLEILISLQTSPRVTAATLAAEHGVSRRTMLRDLHALSEMGLPLAAAPGPHGGYSLMRDRRLLPLSLAPDEAIGIVLSYEAFLQYATSPFSEQSLSAVTKLRAALPPDIVRDMDRLRRHVAVVGAVRSIEAPLLPDVVRAALDGVYLQIQYDSRSGESERRIFPHGVYGAQGIWYCVCHDELRGRVLALRVDRIRALVRVEGLVPPPPVDLREWLRTAESGATDLVPFRARLTRVGARRLEVERIFGRITLDDRGEAIIEDQIPASEIDFYASQLLALADDVVVEAPYTLIEALRNRAASVVALYG